MSRAECAPTPLDRALAVVTLSIPFTVAVWRAAAASQWRGDLPAVRDQGLASIGLGGSLSTVATQALGLLPLGSHTFRASLGSALALSIAALLLYRIGRRLLAVTGTPASLASLLSAVAAVMAALSPTWQQEGTIGGGAMWAVAIVLLGIDRTMLLTGSEARTLTPPATSGWLLLAAICGAALAERLPAGLALLLAVVATAASAGKRPPTRLLPLLFALALLVFVVLSAPLVLRPLSPRSWSDLGHAVSAASLGSLDVVTTRKAALLSWIDEVGLVSLVMAGLGFATGVFREPRRAWMTPLVVLVVVELAYPLAAATQLTADPLAALRCLALGSLAVASALGVCETVVFLRNLTVPMARTASVLTVVFYITVVAVTCEEAAFAADRSGHFAAAEWTDEALAKLPTNAAVLAHSPALTWRLWAAQMLSGQRPDVVVVPAPLLRHGRVTANLVPSEPSVTQLLRDYALVGKASEYGLGLLADARPLMVEFDERWDDHVISHLTVEGPWLRFAPQVLGRADRPFKGVHVLAADGRVASGIASTNTVDAPTACVVARTLKEHATALSLVGMGETTGEMIDDVERLAPGDPFVTGARLRLAHAVRRRRARHSVELRDLLRL